MHRARWQKAMEWPLIVASVVFLVAYAWEVTGNLTGPALVVAEAVQWATWIAFLVDYVANLLLTASGGRWRWFTTHLFDLAIVVLPMLRPLRVLRLVTLLNVLHRTAGAALRGRIIIYAASAASLLVLVSALAVLDSERGHAGAHIATFGDALWWAFVTITTVGYGDLAPVTFEGRLIAVGLMIGGIALLGVVTATMASWIVERVSAEETRQELLTARHIESLEAKIDRLEELLTSRLP